MIKSRWEQYKEKHGTTPIDLFNSGSKKASEDLKKSRLDTCFSCPELISLTKQCKKCGCFMELKAGLEMSKCPIGKW